MIHAEEHSNTYPSKYRQMVEKIYLSGAIFGQGCQIIKLNLKTTHKSCVCSSQFTKTIRTSQSSRYVCMPSSNVNRYCWRWTSLNNRSTGTQVLTTARARAVYPVCAVSMNYFNVSLSFLLFSFPENNSCGCASAVSCTVRSFRQPLLNQQNSSLLPAGSDLFVLRARLLQNYVHR